MEILNNPWVTGIGGGIISGFIVYFVTSRLLSKKQDKEYSQKVKTANNELLYSMRPLVVQKQIPSREVMEAIIESTARKYELNKGDLFDVFLLADDLIREVMENAFLESGQKIEFCKKISELKHEEVTEKQIKQIFEKVVYQKDRLSSQYVSILLAATASMMVLVVTLFLGLKDSLDFNGLNNFSEVSSITLIGILVPMTAMTMTMFLKKIKRIEINNRDNKDEKIDKKDTEIDYIT
jgi:phosphate/sulfate permease